MNTNPFAFANLQNYMQSIAQPQRNPGVQSYMDMLGGGHFGGVIPQSPATRSLPMGASPNMMAQPSPQEPPTMPGAENPFAGALAAPPQELPQSRPMFGSSPWPGVWGR
jgi:hypothetical protein